MRPHFPELNSVVDWVTHLQYQPTLSPILWPLAPVSWGYAGVVQLRKKFYQWGWLKHKTVPVPVISVGNLTTGGTGKTPVVAALATALMEAGIRPVILNRGYGAKRPIPYARAIHPDFGDEAYLLQQQLPEVPVIVGRDRSRTAIKAIVDFRPDVLILDDGFQHIKLNRQQDILLVDGMRGLGNKFLTPAGPLRENIKSIQRAHRLWITRPPEESLDEALEKNNAQAAVQEASANNIPLELVPIVPVGLQSLAPNSPDVPISTIPDLLGNVTKIVAVSAIANPDGFERELHRCGIRPLNHYHFADHHNYTPEEVKEIFIADKPGQKTIWVTTDKDRVKLTPLIPSEFLPSVYTLHIRAELPQTAVQEMIRLFSPALSGTREMASSGSK